MTVFHRARQSARRRLLTDRAGATAIEYALIAALVAIGLVGSIGIVGTGTAGLIDKAADAVEGD